MTRSRGVLTGGVLGGIVLAVGVLAVIVLVVMLAGRPERGGPLQEDVPANAVTFSVLAGTRFTYGGLQIHNQGADPVTLERVRLLGASAGLTIDDARVLRISDTDGELWFNFGRFPPPGLAVDLLPPLAGFRLGADAQQPAAGVQVLLALSVPADGRYEFGAIAVEYRVTGRRYEAIYPFAMRVCVPPQGECPQLGPGG